MSKSQWIQFKPLWMGHNSPWSYRLLRYEFAGDPTFTLEDAIQQLQDEYLAKHGGSNKYQRLEITLIDFSEVPPDWLRAEINRVHWEIEERLSYMKELGHEH